MLKHRFYTKSKAEQNRVQVLIGLSALGIVILSMIIAGLTKIYFLAILAFLIPLTLVAPFFDVPSLKESGRLIYYSLLFITEKPKNETIIIHGGTLFDYVFVIDKGMNGKQRTNFIIQQYLEGILNLIEAHENKKASNLTIRGTSYIINDRTAQRIGFKVVKTDLIQKFILTFNYFNLLVTYSIAKGKLSFPNLNNTKTFETKLYDLIGRKELLKSLNNKLKNTLAKHGYTT